MGNSRSKITDLNLFNKGGVFTKEQLEDYQDTTFFTKKDILRLYKRFAALNPTKVPHNMQGNRPAIVTLSFEEVEKMPELRENPFRRRICEVFSEDGHGNLTFDDFLDMFSVLSELAPLPLKLKYAFRVYDFDQDEQIGREDLRKTIQCLTREELTPEEIDFAVDRVKIFANAKTNCKKKVLRCKFIRTDATDLKLRAACCELPLEVATNCGGCNKLCYRFVSVITLNEPEEVCAVTMPATR